MDRPPTARENDPTELQQAIQSIFDRWDVDGSGQLSLEEFRNGVASEARSPQYKNNPTVRLIAAAVERTGGSKSLE
jgi:Ca2+-binding EF-hand superfamily protein